MRIGTRLATATALMAGLWLAAAAPAAAQQVTGTLGEPDATSTIDGRYLPNPQPEFGGTIGLTVEDSKSWWPPQVVPPQGAPNVLLVMTDDAGYAVAGTFGGVIPTPALDRVANAGLRYTQFHSTALCSPTRAALITGRNHHAVGFGVVSEQATGFPGYDSIIGIENATIGEILRENGYATSWFGKNHNTPAYQYSAAGPFDQWPTGMGFDYFYGFMGGDSSQWAPYLFQNTTQIFPWVGQDGYNLITDMADEAIDHINQLNAAAPDKPFFVYYVPGATHAPHHVPQEWIDKFAGHFDMGWNELREQIFENQKKLGVIPQDSDLTAWPTDLIPEWASLSDDEKKLYTRQAEVFAAYVAYTDHEIGRVIQAIDDLGKLDNTLIIYIEGDNGTSAEGGLHGTPNEVAALNGVALTVEEQLPFLDAWGGPETYPHMSVGWAWAFDTPFQWTKQVASHFGGTRQGMAISWPARIKDVGGIRTQFHHMIDIVPTILDAIGIPEPDMVDGVAQEPMDGVSMVYTWDKESADAPSTRTTQYFEMFGNRGIYHDGWYAATTPPAPPWSMGLGEMPNVLTGYKWELYDLTTDYSQAHDLAGENPEKLQELQDVFLVEAARYGVFPLDNTVIQRVLAPRPSYTAGLSTFTYIEPLVGIPMANAPSIIARDFTITAEVDVPEGGAEGMIATMGGRFGGYGLYLLKGKPVFVYNLFGFKEIRWEGDDELDPGKHTIAFTFTYDGPGPAKGGTGKLSVNGEEVASETAEHTIPFIMPWDESLDVGADTRTAVSKDYELPFRFTGTIDKLTYDLGDSQLVAK